MNLKRKEQIALARFAILFPLLDPKLERGDQARILQEICAKEYEFPGSKKTTVCEATVLNWLRSYRKERSIESLFPAGRSDKGGRRTLDADTEAALRKLRSEHPRVKLTTLVRIAVREGIFSGTDDVSMAVIYRMFKDFDADQKAASTEDIRRFSAEQINDLWMLDALSGPKALVTIGERQKTVTAKLFALIDSKSRLIPYGRFYADETAESLTHCLWNAFSRRGLPKKIYTDRGSAMRDDRVKLGCASLEVHLSYASVRRPVGKGLIERFFRTVRMQFLPLLPTTPLPMHELNRRWEQWLDEYHNRVHSGIGMPPLQCYLAGIRAIRPAPPELPSYFRRREERTVSTARTISLHRRLLEVPLGYAGRRIEIRYTDLHDVEGFYEGKSLGILKPVDIHANAYAQRRRI